MKHFHQLALKHFHSVSFGSMFLATFFAAAALFAEDGFVSLTQEFKNKVGGEATFSIDGDTITGKRGPGANTFLCTEKKYSNFILKFDVKFDIDCNSGVQFRSSIGKKDESQFLAGYQCEIWTDKDTANVYDECRRDRYLVPKEQLQEKIGKLYKKGGWNSITIQCVGPSIKTWLNGEKIVDVIDIEETEGVFGLQVHASKEDGLVRWKNIRIKELPATPWIPLYADGKFGALESKCDWVQTGENTPFGSFVPKPVAVNKILPDGSLSSSTPPKQQKDGILVSKKIYKDFAVKVSFKMEQGNSGVYFRAKENDKAHWLSGFQCEIAMDGKVNAALWEVDGRGWVQKTKETEAVSSKATKEGDWNNIATVAIGDHIVTFLNGQQVMNIHDPNPTHGFTGKVGLQLHGGGNQGCLFNNFYVMPLDDAACKLIAE